MEELDRSLESSAAQEENASETENQVVSRPLEAPAVWLENNVQNYIYEQMMELWRERFFNLMRQDNFSSGDAQRHRHLYIGPRIFHLAELDYAVGPLGDAGPDKPRPSQHINTPQIIEQHTPDQEEIAFSEQDIGVFLMSEISLSLLCVESVEVGHICQFCAAIKRVAKAVAALIRRASQSARGKLKLFGRNPLTPPPLQSNRNLGLRRLRFPKFKKKFTVVQPTQTSSTASNEDNILAGVEAQSVLPTAHSLTVK